MVSRSVRPISIRLPRHSRCRRWRPRPKNASKQMYDIGCYTCNSVLLLLVIATIYLWRPSFYRDRMLTMMATKKFHLRQTSRADSVICTRGTKRKYCSLTEGSTSNAIQLRPIRNTNRVEQMETRTNMQQLYVTMGGGGGYSKNSTKKQ